MSPHLTLLRSDTYVQCCSALAIRRLSSAIYLPPACQVCVLPRAYVCHPGSVSFGFFSFTSYVQAVMQGLTNVSMMYLNYPAKVLFKSSRMVPIMCFGVVWQVIEILKSLTTKTKALSPAPVLFHKKKKSDRSTTNTHLRKMRVFVDKALDLAAEVSF